MKFRFLKAPELCWDEEEVEGLAGRPDKPVEEVDGGELGEVQEEMEVHGRNW